MFRASRHTPAHAIVVWLSLGVVALIAYGSLYPFNLKHSANFDIWHTLSQLSWARAGRGDRVSNVLLYAPLGFCLFLCFDGRVSRTFAASTAVLFAALLSLGIEVAQVFISSRVPSLWDVTLNTCGAIAGVGGGIVWRALSGRLSRTDAGAARGDRAAWLLLFLWVAWRWAPFELQVSLAKLKAALQPLVDPQIEALLCAHYLVWWLIIAQAIFAVANRARVTESLLALIAVTLIGRLFFAEPALIASELLALALLLPALVLLHRLQSMPRRWVLTVAFTSLFLWDSLAPWRFASSAGHFDFWPFMPWIEAGMPVELVWLLQKIFVFAALGWLLKGIGMSPRSVVYAVTLVVVAIECAQLWVPSQSSSVTDPALALAVAWCLLAMDNKSRAVTRPIARSR
ncbi:MAG: VanZ family protein [Candidatus Obscuribacterales bacterium]|nr:VanZ family protein [Steroidobacteraceae bacterium]